MPNGAVLRLRSTRELRLNITCGQCSVGTAQTDSACRPKHLPRLTTRVSTRTRASLTHDDALLRADIRRLGRILGDTVREQEGSDVFDLVERIRQTSIRFHRDDDKLARRELETILDGMSIAETVRIVRAFSYFSHLANIAEDQNNIRQRRVLAMSGAAPDSGTLACALTRAQAGRHRQGRAAVVLCRSSRQPGLDRSPHGSPPQKHHRSRNGNRLRARSARARADDHG